MRKILVLGAGLSLMAPLALAMATMSPRVVMVQERTIRHRSEANISSDHFFAAPSDRKGKGQKKREASMRRSKGWK